MDSFVHVDSRSAGVEHSFSVLGVRVSAVRMGEAIDHIEQRIQEETRQRPHRRCGRYVAVTGMHGVGEAQKNPAFLYALDHADLVVPDGMPLIWLARWRGLPLRERVCGADLLELSVVKPVHCIGISSTAALPAWRKHSPDYSSQRTGITVAGTYTPPFRKLGRTRGARPRAHH